MTIFAHIERILTVAARTFILTGFVAMSYPAQAGSLSTNKIVHGLTVTEKPQRPWHSSDLGAEVYRAAKMSPELKASETFPEPSFGHQPSKIVASSSIPDRASDSCAAAIADWAQIGDGESVATIKTFIDAHPSCPVQVALARERLQILSNLAVKLEQHSESSAQQPSPNNGILNTNSEETQCDRLAANFFDPQKLASVPGVDFASIVSAQAIAACTKAMQNFPNELRFAYQLGRSFDADGQHAAANNLYVKAADLGYAAANYNLGMNYLEGLGTEQDAERALQLLRKAFDLGRLDAAVKIAEIYSGAYGFDKNVNEAFRWRGVANKITIPLVNKGLQHQTGNGVMLDYAEAMRWYERASQAGSDVAQVLIGHLHLKGLGVEQDPGKAREWYGNAAEKGDHLHVAFEIARGFDGLGEDYNAAVWYVRALAVADKHALWEIKRTFPTWRSSTRKTFQEMLTREGGLNVPTDGEFGPDTWQAMNAVFGTAIKP